MFIKTNFALCHPGDKVPKLWRIVKTCHILPDPWRDGDHASSQIEYRMKTSEGKNDADRVRRQRKDQCFTPPGGSGIAALGKPAAGENRRPAWGPFQLPCHRGRGTAGAMRDRLPVLLIRIEEGILPINTGIASSAWGGTWGSLAAPA